MVRANSTFGRETRRAGPWLCMLTHSPALGEDGFLGTARGVGRPSSEERERRVRACMGGRHCRCQACAHPGRIAGLAAEASADEPSADPARPPADASEDRMPVRNDTVTDWTHRLRSPIEPVVVAKLVGRALEECQLPAARRDVVPQDVDGVVVTLDLEVAVVGRGPRGRHRVPRPLLPGPGESAWRPLRGSGASVPCSALRSSRRPWPT